MPEPGKAVIHGKDFNGEIQKIDSDFMKYVQDLVPSICAPEHLTVKKISGEPVRVAQFIEYLHAYVNIFNSNELPEPKTVLAVSFSLL